MKHILWILALIPLATVVQAADEFGDRFANDTPAALEDTPANSVAEIEPAAGDSEKKAEKMEEGLEKATNAEVKSTVQDLGDNQEQIHNSIGDEDVHLFHQNQTDERLNDEADAVGVEVEVLEFE